MASEDGGQRHWNHLINEGIELLSEDLRKDTFKVIDTITKHGPDICRPLCQVLANQAAMMSAIALLLDQARD